MRKRQPKFPTTLHLPVRNISLLRHKAKARNYYTRPQRHRGHELIYLDYGQVRLKIGARALEAQAGDCVIVAPNTVHHMRGAKGQPFDFLNLVYSGDTPQRLLNRVLHLSADERRLLADIKKESLLQDRHWRELVITKLNEFLLQLDRRAASEAPVPALRGLNREKYRNAMVERALCYLELHLSRPLAADVLAQHVGLSASRLQVLVRQETGRTLSQHLRTIRLRMACQLLHESAQNIDEIAYRVGYRSVPHFCTIFKREVGMTPTAFTQSLGKPEDHM